ncbi:MAG: hypothetical protein ACO3UU_02765 [Minisyncoccia bacterium]|jgi:chromosome segregation ATPase
MNKGEYQDILNEYKDQIRILKDQISELESTNKNKDASLKRTLQKLEYVTDDLDKANKQIQDLKDKYEKEDKSKDEDK